MFFIQNVIIVRKTRKLQNNIWNAGNGKKLTWNKNKTNFLEFMPVNFKEHGNVENTWLVPPFNG